MILVIINAIIWTGLGYFWGRLHTKRKGWSKWEDVGINYNSAECDWYMLQQRSNSETGDKQYKHVRVQKYGNIGTELLNKLDGKGISLKD